MVQTSRTCLNLTLATHVYIWPCHIKHNEKYYNINCIRIYHLLFEPSDFERILSLRLEKGV